MVQFSDETILLSTVTQTTAVDDLSKGRILYLLLWINTTAAFLYSFYCSRYLTLSSFQLLHILLASLIRNTSYSIKSSFVSGCPAVFKKLEKQPYWVLWHYIFQLIQENFSGVFFKLSRRRIFLNTWRKNFTIQFVTNILQDNHFHNARRGETSNQCMQTNIEYMNSRIIAPKM